ncbi:uncharacterized protein EI90DRAFT_3014509 [Cantharellus anzutake]|uniref:uncharacterized protein n=1 Tax=Cantharellus anzutake TaxID=1750568 RepID=UPI001903CF68|nr:uncharacterized protein EI90DRAFT_3014509 [Cantharellus anzutake]KAF8335917.1 hypothetical protein EI90DRAFT_3014509 [Cantharellus anzutake]
MALWYMSQHMIQTLMLKQATRSDRILATIQRTSMSIVEISTSVVTAVLSVYAGPHTYVTLLTGILPLQTLATWYETQAGQDFLHGHAYELRCRECGESAKPSDMLKPATFDVIRTNRSHTHIGLATLLERNGNRNVCCLLGQWSASRICAENIQRTTEAA